MKAPYGLNRESREKRERTRRRKPHKRRLSSCATGAMPWEGRKAVGKPEDLLSTIPNGCRV
ncbi:hypothetical protein KL86DES1_10485 [uncultured Desulfovibrio sp.]|uniref:Uncharacterized protein n=1 Tax=uncultured Desulfovibrio sp. TaxID=167968 RepID=A0A212KZ85_9BACT|nr:hypothetical protein KL86DES1_10485 [uncultured Desulfovibrio sp.]VZH32359.1 conserved protein of unknown function [Desulfovibrio sp. 86]